MKILDYMQTMEESGCKIVFDAREQIPEQGDYGTVFQIVDPNGKLHFVGIATPKVLGEWIKIHGSKSGRRRTRR